MAAAREDAEQRVEPSLPLHLFFSLHHFPLLFCFDLVSARCEERMELGQLPSPTCLPRSDNKRMNNTCMHFHFSIQTFGSGSRVEKCLDLLLLRSLNLPFRRQREMSPVGGSDPLLRPVGKDQRHRWQIIYRPWLININSIRKLDERPT